MLAIIQARMSSERLPGKVLRTLAGRPMLDRVYTRLKSAQSLSPIVIATSIDRTDDPINEYCERYGISCYRGSLGDVAARFLACVRQYEGSAFLRISGDSPLIDPEVVEQALNLFESGQYDLVTNVQVRSFPKGQSVEIVSAKAFTRAIPNFRDARDREHVTRYFYAHPQQFSICNFTSGQPMGDIQLSVDTFEDFEAIETILQEMGEAVTWREAALLRMGIGQ